MLGEIKVTLEDFPEETQKNFKDGMKEGNTLYLLKFAKKESNKGVRVVRGVTLMKCEADTDSTLKLVVKFDGAQYRFDMLNLAVEESMFVEDIYESC